MTNTHLQKAENKAINFNSCNCKQRFIMSLSYVKINNSLQIIFR